MRQVYQLMPGVEGSMDMYYSGNDQDYRCVGHIRGDFGKSGDEYWATFWEHEGINVAGEGCKEELTALVNTLRKNLLKSRKAMRKYIQQHLLLILEAGAIMSYGYQVTTTTSAVRLIRACMTFTSTCMPGRNDISPVKTIEPRKRRKTIDTRLRGDRRDHLQQRRDHRRFHDRRGDSHDPGRQLRAGIP